MAILSRIVRSPMMGLSTRCSQEHLWVFRRLSLPFLAQVCDLQISANLVSERV